MTARSTKAEKTSRNADGTYFGGVTSEESPRFIRLSLSLLCGFLPRRTRIFLLLAPFAILNLSRTPFSLSSGKSKSLFLLLLSLCLFYPKEVSFRLRTKPSSFLLPFFSPSSSSSTCRSTWGRRRVPLASLRGVSTLSFPRARTTDVRCPGRELHDVVLPPELTSATFSSTLSSSFLLFAKGYQKTSSRRVPFERPITVFGTSGWTSWRFSENGLFGG